ncbi:hypothetical protein [Leucobacter luti]|nr:hypothetical protein [Leucobacter luti]
MPEQLVTRRWPSERWEDHLGEQLRRARTTEAPGSAGSRGLALHRD